MQRKSRILNSSKKPAFVMILSISIMVVVATILALSLSLTNQTTKQTNDLYLYEQATLMSKSAAEYALLKISENPLCSVTHLNFTQDTIYKINIDMKYVYSAPSPCSDTEYEYFNITTAESSGIVLMDITVTIDDTNIVSEPIRVFRRSLQKL